MGPRQNATGQKTIRQKATRQKATGQKATERKVNIELIIIYYYAKNAANCKKDNTSNTIMIKLEK